MTEARCLVEGCTARPSFGFRWPGHRSSMPEEQKKFGIWACPEHRADGQRRWIAAIIMKGGKPPAIED